MSRRLLIVSRCHEPRGGADRIIADLCRSLPSRGWEVELGLTVGARFNRAQPYRALYPDLPIVEIDGSFGTRRARVLALREAIDRSSPDVVLGMRVFDVIEAVASSASSPRLAYGVRALEAAYVEDVRRFGDAIDACITSGRLIGRLCETHGQMPSRRVFSIGGGVVAPARERVVAGTGEPLRLLYAGRLDHVQKRVLDLPEILTRLDALGVRWEMDIVGAGPAETALRTALEAFLAPGRVRMHGWCSREELYDRHYPAADVMLHTAAWEGITIAPREAMVHGVVPVITSFPGALAEGIYRDEETALVYPVGDVDAAARCVQRLATDSMLFEKLSSGARASQDGERGADGAIAAWADALERMLELPKRAGRDLPACPDEATDGRLSRLGLPPYAEHALRRVLRRPVVHGDAGSEWPTASGLLRPSAQQEIERLMSELDRP